MANARGQQITFAEDDQCAASTPFSLFYWGVVMQHNQIQLLWMEYLNTKRSSSFQQQFNQCHRLKLSFAFSVFEKATAMTSTTTKMIDFKKIVLFVISKPS